MAPLNKKPATQITKRDDTRGSQVSTRPPLRLKTQQGVRESVSSKKKLVVSTPSNAAFPASDSEYINVSSGSSSSASITEISPPPPTQRSYTSPSVRPRRTNSSRAGSQNTSVQSPKKQTDAFRPRTRSRSAISSSSVVSASHIKSSVKLRSSRGKTRACPIILESDDDEEEPPQVFVGTRSPLKLSQSSNGQAHSALTSTNSSPLSTSHISPLSASSKSPTHSNQERRSPKRTADTAFVTSQSSTKRARHAKSPSPPSDLKTSSDSEIIPGSEGEYETNLMPLPRGRKKVSLLSIKTLGSHDSEMEIDKVLLCEPIQAAEVSIPCESPSLSVPTTPSMATMVGGIPPSVAPTSTKASWSASASKTSSTIQERCSDDSDSDGSVDSRKAFKRAMKRNVALTPLDDDDDEFLLTGAELLRPQTRGVDIGKRQTNNKTPPPANQVKKGGLSFTTSSPLSEVPSPPAPRTKQFANLAAPPGRFSVPTVTQALPSPAQSLQEPRPSHHRQPVPSGSLPSIALPQTPKKQSSATGATLGVPLPTNILNGSLIEVLDQPGKMNDMLKVDQEDFAHVQQVKGFNQSLLGQCLWRPTPGSSKIQTSLQTKLEFPPSANPTHLVASLAESVKRGDAETTTALLASGCLMNESPLADTLIDWLLDLTCLEPRAQIGRAAFEAIVCLMRASMLQDIELDWSTVRRLLVGLGVRQDFLALVPSTPDDSHQDSYTPCFPENRNERSDRVARLVQTVGLFAKRRQIAYKDEPAIALSLAFIALDGSSLPHVKEEARRVMKLVLACIEKRTRTHRLELAAVQLFSGACEKVSKESQLAILQLLTGPDQQSTRITRWVAYGLLFGVSPAMKSEERYYKAPPTARILSLALSNDMETDETAFSRHSMRLDRDTDYNALRFTATILSYVLTGIDSYVAADKEAQSESLPHIVGALQTVQGKIVDHRASNLDKTYAKNAIHHLSTRLAYQTKFGSVAPSFAATTKPNDRGTNKITSFFAKKNP